MSLRDVITALFDPPEQASLLKPIRAGSPLDDHLN
jgi:hypothetical protein